MGLLVRMISMLSLLDNMGPLTLVPAISCQPPPASSRSAFSCWGVQAFARWSRVISRNAGIHWLTSETSYKPILTPEMSLISCGVVHIPIKYWFFFSNWCWCRNIIYWLNRLPSYFRSFHMGYRTLWVNGSWWNISVCEATHLTKKMAECETAESNYKDFLTRANLK